MESWLKENSVLTLNNHHSFKGSLTTFEMNVFPFHYKLRWVLFIKQSSVKLHLHSTFHMSKHLVTVAWHGSDFCFVGSKLFRVQNSWHL